MASASPSHTATPLVINLPPTPRGRIVRSWVRFTLASIFVTFLLFGGPLVFVAHRVSDGEWEVLRRGALLVAAAVVATTAAFNVPRLVWWPRREQLIEVTPDAIVIATIGPWWRTRRQCRIESIERVTIIHGQVVVQDARKRGMIVADFLSRAEARRLAQTLRQALGLPQDARVVKKS